MRKRNFALLVGLFLFIFVGGMAAVSAETTPSTVNNLIVEGTSIPNGVEIGMTRAQVGTLLGGEGSCSFFFPYSCRYPLGDGYFGVIYTNDLVTQVDISIREWQTTAGADMTMRYYEVQDLYPNSVLIENGGTRQVVDEAMGYEYYEKTTCYAGSCSYLRLHRIMTPESVPTVVTLNSAETITSSPLNILAAMLGLAVFSGLSAASHHSYKQKSGDAKLSTCHYAEKSVE